MSLKWQQNNLGLDKLVAHLQQIQILLQTTLENLQKTLKK